MHLTCTCLSRTEASTCHKKIYNKSITIVLVSYFTLKLKTITCWIKVNNLWQNKTMCTTVKCRPMLLLLPEQKPAEYFSSWVVPSHPFQMSDSLPILNCHISAGWINVNHKQWKLSMAMQDNMINQHKDPVLVALTDVTTLSSGKSDKQMQQQNLFVEQD